MPQPAYTLLDIVEQAAEWMRGAKRDREIAKANGREPLGSVAFVERHAIDLLKQALKLSQV